MIKQTLLSLGLAIALVMSTHAAPKPNIVLILVDGHTVTATFQENGARVVRADVHYAIDAPLPPNQTIQEWFLMEAEIDNGSLKATVPPEASQPTSTSSTRTISS
jgi:hypothetical protein